ncbi:MAG: hypothetical protein WCR72_14720 [Bacteroidota bacterium]
MRNKLQPACALTLLTILLVTPRGTPAPSCCMLITLPSLPLSGIGSGV